MKNDEATMAFPSIRKLAPRNFPMKSLVMNGFINSTVLIFAWWFYGKLADSSGACDRPSLYVFMLSRMKNDKLGRVLEIKLSRTEDVRPFSPTIFIGIFSTAERSLTEWRSIKSWRFVVSRFDCLRTSTTSSNSFGNFFLRNESSALLTCSRKKPLWEL